MCLHDQLAASHASVALARAVWLLYRQPNGARVGGIILVADIERLDELGRHQLNLVVHARQRSRPMLRAANGVQGTGARLQWAPALADAAARVSKGETADQAIRSAGYRARRIFHATLRGYESPAAVAHSLAQRHCNALANPEFTGMGSHREGNSWWIVLAARFEPPDLADAGAVAARVLVLTNEARAQRRLCGDRWFDPAGPLRYNTALERAARAHAQDMARHSYLDHASRDGRSAGDRATEAGYRWRSIGENIASGQPTAQEVVRAWLRSPQHCSAIMHSSFSEMGVAFAVNANSEPGIYWAQEFGRSR